MKGNTKIGTLENNFEKAWKKHQADPYSKNLRNESGTRVKDKSPDWKEFIIRPIVKALCEVGGYKMENEELRQFGLRSHVPVTLIGENDALYLDLSHNGGWVMITDFTAKPTENYPSNSIGKINGFDLEQIEFKEEQTIDDVVNYVLNNKEKFLSNLFSNQFGTRSINMERKYTVTDIKYDTDGEEVDLPKELGIVIPEDIEDDEILDYISDEISNRTGFCHFGFVTNPPIVS